MAVRCSEWRQEFLNRQNALALILGRIGLHQITNNNRAREDKFGKKQLNGQDTCCKVVIEVQNQILSALYQADSKGDSNQLIKQDKAMNVHIEELNAKMELGNNGILLKVYDNKSYKGKLRIGSGTIEWCKGRTQVGNGEKVNWNKLISFFEER